MPSPLTSPANVSPNPQALISKSMASSSPPSFTDFPNDVHIHIFSFLSPLEISALACVSRHFSSLCSPSSSSSSSIYLSICGRRWGSKTVIPRWNHGQNIHLLYKTLDRWDPLLGFWRQIGTSKNPQSPPLVFFEWGPNSITGSRISPSDQPGSYDVVKKPFLWLGMLKKGEPVSFLLCLGSDPVPVSVSFMGENHMVVEESAWGLSDEDEDFRVSGSPPAELTSEVYRYFANRTSPGGGRRKKGGRRRRWEAEHFVKIGNCCPSPGRPLQGLWKGICESMSLDFYLVTYDDVGGITCRRVGNSGDPFSGYYPVFWTSNTTFLNSPFSTEERDLYASRQHVSPSHLDIEKGVVSRILSINSSYDLVLPNLSSSSGDPRNVEGRIWVYENGTFGFGFLRNNVVINLKHIAVEGCLLDTPEYCGSSSSVD